MSYRIQIELGENISLMEKVQLHAKFLRHFQRRKLNADARGRTKWGMEFISERGRFTIIWARRPQPGITASTGPNLRWQHERFMGFVVIKFSKADIDLGGPFIVVADCQALEDEILKQEKVS